MIGFLRRLTALARTRRRNTALAIRLRDLDDHQLADIGLTRDGINAMVDRTMLGGLRAGAIAEVVAVYPNDAGTLVLHADALMNLQAWKGRNRAARIQQAPAPEGFRQQRRVFQIFAQWRLQIRAPIYRCSESPE